jgi:hypothetical protein
MRATGNRSIEAGTAEQRIAPNKAAGIAAADDRRDAMRESLLDFLRNSPLAEAMAEGKLHLARDRDRIRDVSPVVAGARGHSDTD